METHGNLSFLKFQRKFYTETDSRILFELLLSFDSCFVCLEFWAVIVLPHSLCRRKYMILIMPMTDDDIDDTIKKDEERQRKTKSF